MRLGLVEAWGSSGKGPAAAVRLYKHELVNMIFDTYVYFLKLGGVRVYVYFLKR
jgi:hypothetical protein